MHSSSAIGVFDSGLGGLSVLADIRQQLPAEQLIYIADAAYVPYGDKNAEQIIERCILLSEFLLDRGVKALVVACNTATAMAIHVLRERWPNLLVIGMEPAVKPAAQFSQSGQVGVLATSGTLLSAKFAALRDQYAAKANLHTVACLGLVELIEAGELNSQATKELLSNYVQPLLDAGCDSIILGCTHYPFIKPLLRELVGEQVAIIDTGLAVAKRLQQQLAEHELLNQQVGRGEEKFYTTGESNKMQLGLELLWPEQAQAKQLLL